MNHRNNRRSEATKNKIKQTLIDMLHEQDINKITVQALCERAAINRSTFYNHYESPFSVLSSIEGDFTSSLTFYINQDDCRENTYAGLTLLLTHILEYIKSNPNICFLLQVPHLRQSFQTNVFRNAFKTTMLSHPIFDKFAEESLVYAQNFILYGCGSVIDLWLQGNCKESPQEIAQLLAGFIYRL